MTRAIVTKGREVPEDFELDDYISEYLSAVHRDEPGSGCAFAALGCEMPRQSRRVRERFTAGVRGMIGLLSGRMDSGLKPRQREVASLVLARADPKLSNDIVRATRSRLSD